LVHAIEMAFKSVNVVRPEATELFEPGIEFLKRSGLEPVEATLRVDCGFDEAGVAKNAEMLGDCGLGHVELAFDLADGLLVERQEAKNRAAVGLGDDVESVFHGLYMP
jgi:hypothetical protein